MFLSPPLLIPLHVNKWRAILAEDKKENSKSRLIIHPHDGSLSFTCACRKAIVYHVRLPLTMVPVSSCVQLFSQLVGSCSGLALPGQPARQPARPPALFARATLVSGASVAERWNRL